MAPKRGKKKQKNEEEFDDEKQSMWAKVLETKIEEQGDPEEVYGRTEKVAFEYDFSKNTYVEDQPLPPKQKPVELTEEEKELLKKIEEKEKQDKEKREKIKTEKRKERKKQKEEQKQKDKIQKEKQLQEDRKVEEEIKKNQKKSNGCIIPIFLFLLIIGMGFLQYQTQLHAKIAKFKLSQSQNLYELLETDQGSTDAEIKAKYKKLVLKYHPDRNPNCQNCKQKFDGIMKAWEVLGNEEKRKAYDQNRGFISEIKSQSVTLTPDNYHYLVEQSRSLWIIQVYDSTNNYAHFFSQFWEQAIDEYGDVIKFGRVDVWHQSNMLSYIPYKFQVFPGLYLIDKGYPQLCAYDFERPMLSIRRCIENYYENYQITGINSNQIMNDKPTVLLHPKLKNSLRVKATSKKYENDMVFHYQLDVEKNIQKKIVKTFIKTKEGVQTFQFQFKDNSKKNFEVYNNFLQSFIVQDQSICHFLNFCEERKCVLILKNPIKMPYSSDPLHYYPTIQIKQKQPFLHDIERIKNITDLHENFEIGLYEEGKIDLGYVNELDQLQPSNGEFMDLKCKKKTWWSMIEGVMEYFR